MSQIQLLDIEAHGHRPRFLFKLAVTPHKECNLVFEYAAAKLSTHGMNHLNHSPRVSEYLPEFVQFRYKLLVAEARVLLAYDTAVNPVISHLVRRRHQSR